MIYVTLRLGFLGNLPSRKSCFSTIEFYQVLSNITPYASTIFHIQLLTYIHEHTYPWAMLVSFKTCRRKKVTAVLWLTLNRCIQIFWIFIKVLSNQYTLQYFFFAFLCWTQCSTICPNYQYKYTQPWSKTVDILHVVRKHAALCRVIKKK
jgi:hypothetical protein